PVNSLQFVNFAETLGVLPVHGFSELWRQHIVTVVHFLKSFAILTTNRNGTQWIHGQQFCRKGSQGCAVPFRQFCFFFLQRRPYKGL
uniref:Uncharacterized protein n=1 Tax=Parascaris univalens TaxID=6257 RepID=A0A915AJU6_PARUN